MYAKLVVLACLVGVSLAKWHGPLAGGLPADLYPAGISPQACPNFPNCDNPAVALTSSVPAHGAGAGGWNGAGAGGGWNGGHNNGGWNGAGAGAGGWNGAGAGGWNGGHNNGGWNGGNNNGAWNGRQSALDNGDYTGDGDYHGEGLAESGAYGNGYHH